MEHRVPNQPTCTKHSLVSTRQHADTQDVSSHGMQAPRAPSDNLCESSIKQDAEAGSSGEVSTSSDAALPLDTEDTDNSSDGPAPLQSAASDQEDEANETSKLETQVVAPLDSTLSDAPAPAWQIFPEDKHQLYITTKEPETIAAPSQLHDVNTPARTDATIVADTPQCLYAPPLPLPAPQTRSPLEVYHQVHCAVVRLQTFTRGYLVRPCCSRTHSLLLGELDDADRGLAFAHHYVCSYVDSSTVLPHARRPRDEELQLREQHSAAQESGP